MTTIKRSFRLSPTKAAAALARLDILGKPTVSTPAKPGQESYAGWSWAEGTDPYLQAES